MEHNLLANAADSNTHLGLQQNSDIVLQILRPSDAELSEMKQEPPAEHISPNASHAEFPTVRDVQSVPVCGLDGLAGEMQPSASVTTRQATCGLAGACVGDGNQPTVLEMGSVLPDKGDEMECRVCHLNLFNQPDCGDAIELGCACKHDLAAAHRICAEAWFKIRGNRNCEICGVVAKNIMGIEMEAHSRIQERPTNIPETNIRWWNRMPICNLLISLFITAILLPWLFHINLYK
ncbi:hypothetical protein O6H91_01G020600 [Diphasiastrum complanatum]|uniref:Uncharacterized protein n=1 Tax=Diphasiastrum complanatum TaxID=34168 RepID=A0ACC2ENX8_DIPCM|nr:hypothetical protein O6H91_01G020600 [Diphasiastrum complanatum]